MASSIIAVLPEPVGAEITAFTLLPYIYNAEEMHDLTMKYDGKALRLYRIQAFVSEEST